MTAGTAGLVGDGGFLPRKGNTGADADPLACPGMYPAATAGPANPDASPGLL